MKKVLSEPVPLNKQFKNAGNSLFICRDDPSAKHFHHHKQKPELEHHAKSWLDEWVTYTLHGIKWPDEFLLDLRHSNPIGKFCRFYYQMPNTSYYDPMQIAWTKCHNPCNRNAVKLMQMNHHVWKQNFYRLMFLVSNKQSNSLYNPEMTHLWKLIELRIDYSHLEKCSITFDSNKFPNQQIQSTANKKTEKFNSNLFLR